MALITYKRAETSEELKGILNLQEQNLRENTSETEKIQEGFVTVKHDISVLRPMFYEIDKTLDNKSYVTMEQVCVDKNHRKRCI